MMISSSMAMFWPQNKNKMISSWFINQNLTTCPLYSQTRLNQPSNHKPPRPHPNNCNRRKQTPKASPQSRNLTHPQPLAPLTRSSWWPHKWTLAPLIRNPLPLSLSPPPLKVNPPPLTPPPLLNPIVLMLPLTKVRKTRVIEMNLTNPNTPINRETRRRNRVSWK